MHEKPKNRDWVKNAAIIFLAVLLVLTFFSNTIMNRSLPEVATQGVTDGSIVARVRGTGTVVANSNTQVKMEKTRVIRSVLVKVGQQVQAGDVLFTLGEGSSEDIDAAEDKLRQLQSSYNRTAVTIPVHDYTTDNRKIGLLGQKLSAAQESLAVAERAAKAATPYVDQVAAVELELERAVKARDAAKIEYDKARGEDESTNIRSVEYYTAKGSLVALQTELNNEHENMVVRELDNYQVALIRILVGDHELDGDLLNDSLYDNRSKIDTQIDRVQALIDGVAYTITFKNYDNSVLQSSTLAYGTVPAYFGETPTKPSDDQYSYSFKGWTPLIEIVTKDAVYTAEFNSSVLPPDTTGGGNDTNQTDTNTGTTINISGDIGGDVIINNGGTSSSVGINTPSSGTPDTTTPDTTTPDTTTPDTTTPDTTTPDTTTPDTTTPDTTTPESLTSETISLDTVTVDTASAEAMAFNTLMNSIENLTETDTLTKNESDTQTVTEQDTSEETNEDSVTIVQKSPATGEKTKDELEEWKKDLELALQLYDEAESYKYYKEQIANQKKAIYEAAVAEAEKWGLALQTYLDTGTAESAVYKSKLEAYNLAKDAYDTAVETLNQKRVADQQTDAGYNIDLADTWQQIEKAKQKLADLTGGEEAQILARVSGTIQTIDASPGDTKQKDDIIATIEAPDMGYSLSFSVTNDQANRLRPGDTATVSNFYWGTEIVATLNSIKIDQKNPQTNKLLTFDLSGNVTAGSELTLSVGQKSANYDIIIPSSSIRTDANGSFVLKVESKNSPLGNRYIARRVPVEVLASDDSNSAVSADLSFGDYVITTSSAPIKSGDLVRLAAS